MFADNLLEQERVNEFEFVFALVQPSERERQIVLELCRQLANVTLIETDGRATLYQTWNQCILRSSSELLTNANGDDLRTRDSLVSQLRYMQDTKEVDVAYSGHWEIRNRPKLHSTADCKIEIYRAPQPTALTILLAGYAPPCAAPVWRKSLHEKFGLFRENMHSAGDAEFWLRCLLMGSAFGIIDKPYSKSYLNPNGLSTKPDSTAKSEWSTTLQNLELRLVFRYLRFVKLNKHRS